jgi:hypothetical protein
MKAVGFSDESLIFKHHQFRAHPIFNPDFARENLVSLAETVVMLAFYASIVILLLHWAVVLGYFKTQTITWAVIEGATKFLLYKIPENLQTDRFSIFLAIITTVFAARLARHAFELVKADLHPKKSKYGQKNQQKSFRRAAKSAV